jgi:hypothetical protein
MFKINCVKYDLAKNLLHEADVLLFREHGWPSYFLIRKMDHSLYNHVGLASRHNGENSIWENIEFRGFTGGRTVSLEEMVKQKTGIIDVYRPVPYRIELSYNVTENKVIRKKINCNYKGVTCCMRKLTGMSYGWRRIWWMVQWYIPGLRLFYYTDKIIDDEVENISFPICSSSVPYSFSYNNFDLLKNRADGWMKPGDIALSPYLNYLFTLTV